jgi:DNA sulfur modification protein DndE
MSFNRIYVGEAVDQRLRLLKTRTGLTPNLLCRIGFCLSLSESGVPELDLYTAGVQREFNRYTLTGQWDTFFFALLRERMVSDGLDIEQELEQQFKAHISRGVSLLAQRVRTLSDVADLVRRANPREDARTLEPPEADVDE